MEKVTIAISGVLVGFLVNRVYDWVSYMLWQTKIRSSLVEELTLVHDDILFVKSIIKTKIEGSESIGAGSYPRKISYPIYEKYYADVCLNFNNSQRSSFQQIYTGIEELNSFIVELYTECSNDDYCSSNGTHQRLAGSYSTANDILFLIKNHVEHPRFPLIGDQVNAELKLNREKTDSYLRKYGFKFN
ncbi:hypothetical protein ACEZN7_003048 [Vibrio parahaemolyticus]|uniref:hypothetical protein n=2 Tax=Vibrio TaxID=662 RepID=UPI001123DDE0|nr:MULTISPECIES: hypothetical protein [Vibrio]EGQ7674280.1 hypothetical protein [Vibrio parahaemolyticus]EGQ7752043.1 hypothetical protein [Vibrio parahaemolyticus]EGQ9814444.1 hypothetical protein [Vibrio parahaemolyticus]EHD7120799.1 hypothetical protein [Vibrio parahaemolyticus]EHD7133942.1 hypothetical protein [Vibrio parahaemolyticus]